MWSLSARILLLVALAATSLYPRSGHKVAIYGTVRDADGNPIKHAWLSVYAGSYATTGSTAVVPIITDRAVGAVVIQDPNTIEMHNVHGKGKQFWADDNGEFRCEVDGGYQYTLQAFDHTPLKHGQKKGGRGRGLGVEVRVNVGENMPVKADLVLHPW
jgi:hypothetical protein